MKSKINWLVNNTSSGDIVLQSWLSDHGIMPQLARKYCQSKWLIKLSSGVYYRAGYNPKWQHAIHCLQKQSNFKVHLAGLTSLSYQGKAHYLQLSEESIWINVQGQNILPKWFKTFPNLVVSEDSKFQWEVIKTSKLIDISEDDLVSVNIDGI